MMNKKRIGALLIGATLLVGALGSFAYFTSKTGVKGNGTDGALQKLEITNGKVLITSKVDTGENTNYDWTYDVARISSSITGDAVNKHRSPDINVADKDKQDVALDIDGDGKLDTIKRAVIGAALPTTVTYTRPGDAIVLGNAKTDGTAAGGLTITNESNLTIKLRLIVKDTDEAAGIQNTQIAAMQAAGWKMYINSTEVDLSALSDGVSLGVIGAGATISSVDIRFELPTATGNNYQEKVAAGTGDSALDLNKLIEIQATQENNTAWEQMDQANYTPSNEASE